MIYKVQNEQDIEATCKEYFQKLPEIYKKSMICDWLHIRKELDTTDKDIFVTFRGAEKAQSGNRLQGILQ